MPGHVEELHGSTHDLDSWLEMISGPEPPFWWIGIDDASSDFEGRLNRLVLDDIALDIIETSGAHHNVHRVDDRIATIDEPYCTIRLQVSGSSTLTHPERRVPMSEGMIAISRLDTPYNWEFMGESKVAVFHFPLSTLGPKSPELPAESGLLVTADDPIGLHVSPFVNSVIRDPGVLRAPGGSGFARHIVGLLTTGLVPDPAVDDHPTALPLYERILQFIRANIADPDLDLTRIANANYVSKRYLQSAFHEHNTTLSSWLRQKRLTEIRKDLGNPDLRGLSIGEIGTKWGLVDQAYLSRVFRAAFSETPTQWRRRALGFSDIAVKSPAE